MDSTHFLRLAIALIVTYLMHSTLLLSTAWCIDRRRWLSRHSVREKLWKCAAIAPLLTAFVQIGWTHSSPVWELELGSKPAELAESAAWNSVGDLAPFVRQRPARSEETTPQNAESVPTALMKTPQSHELGKTDVDGSAIVLVPAVSGNETGAQSQSDHSAQQDDGEDWIVQVTPKRTSKRTSPEPLSVQQIYNTATDSASNNSNAIIPQLPTRIAASHRPLPKRDTLRATEELLSHRNSSPINDPNPLSLAQRADVPSGFLFATWVVVAWIVVGFLRLCVLAVRIVLHLRSCVVAVEEITAATKVICDERGITRPVRVLSSARVAEPAACGILSWIILLPTGIEKHLSRDELTALLAHELGHLVRRDTVWIWIGRILTSCCSWQPLNLLAVHRWQQATEFQCDDWAVRETNSRVVLARVLTTVAEFKTKHSFSPGVSATAPPLSLRIERLLNSGSLNDACLSRKRKTVLLAMMLASLGAVTFFAPRLVWADVQETQPSVITSDHEGAGKKRALAKSETEQVELMRHDLQALIADFEVVLHLLNEQERDEATQAQAEAVLEHLARLRDAAK